MGIRFASLGSGSEGNALVVQVDGTTLMLDCGFSLAETALRLARLALTPEDIDGIVVTHEHSDHIGGVKRFAHKYHTPVWMTHGTARHYQRAATAQAPLHIVDPHATFTVGHIQVIPYIVPHDANEPVQYVFSDGAKRLGVLTDVGATTPHIEAALTGCEALVLECNHDLDLLLQGPYPISLKRRVAGRFGHLDNVSSAAILKKLDCSKLEHIAAAHLSRQNNRPELARAALAGALNCAPDWIGVADQDEGLTWRAL